MKPIVILHFQPLELYPPIQNLLNELSDKSTENVIVFTTWSSEKLTPLHFEGRIRIIRLGRSGKRVETWQRFLGYFFFYIGATFILLLKRPAKVLYFETLSSFPVYLYKRFVNRSCEVFIHYHEYTSPREFTQGMFLTRHFHKLEKWLYPQTEWVSHTNEHRMEMFKKDIHPITFKNQFILPNYPPKSWYSEPKKTFELPVKVVYVGALGLSTMFLKEFSEWILRQQGHVVWDIYSYNYNNEVATYFRELNSDWINLMPGVDYSALPGVLKQYDVGVILYKGHIPNYIYNAPNKLFEYVVCGLDVWFPDVMLGSLAYQTISNAQKIVSLDFAQLDQFRIENVLNKNGQALDQMDYFCERALKPLIITLNSSK